LLVAVDKRVAEWKLKEILEAVSRCRNALEAYRKKGDAAGVDRCEQLLKINYAGIRKHCAEYDLELPHDVPPEDAE
jgi:hypothetical protein